jgi:GT2 family glycosyltransferase
VTAEVTAVVLNWNGRGVVDRAVRSLLAQDAPVDVVVVDNGSSDGSDQGVEQEFGSRVRLVRNGRNLGYGAGNNVALRALATPWVLLLNHDVEAAPSLVRELLEVARRAPQPGMVAPKVLQHARPELIDTAGHLLYWDGLNRGRGRGEADRGQYDGSPEALFPSGAAALYARGMLEDIGLFDETLFLYGDDAELGLRGRLAGYGCAFAPRAVAWHRGSHSAGGFSTLKAFHVERSRVLLVLKLFPWPLVLSSPAFTAWRLLRGAAAAAAGRGAAARLAQDEGPLHLVGVTVRAWASAARAAPEILRGRRRFAPRRRMGLAGVLHLLRAYPLGVEAALRE